MQPLWTGSVAASFAKGVWCDMAIVTTAVLGYPRIGENREWKKTLEAFWKGEIDESAFRAAMRDIRIRRLRRMKQTGVTWIPSGDFTFYDSMLDHAAAFNLVPDRFRRLGAPDSLAVYFAMARGAQDAPACEMTKWFDTNYHYLVPELYGAPQPRLLFNPWRDAFAEARSEAGLHTRPVMIGPYTFVRLSRGVAADRLADAVRSLLPVYAAALAGLADAGATWVQLDEPALVTDVPEAHVPLLREAYAALRAAAPGLKLMLQTYFGDVEHPEAVFALPVDGIGLDFVRGKGNLDAVRRLGWPTGKTLGAGVVDGRGVWRVDPDRALSVLDELAAVVPPERLIVQPSCSLLHVPVTVRGERSGDPVVRGALAFADEKLEELVALAEALERRWAAKAKGGNVRAGTGARDAGLPAAGTAFGETDAADAGAAGWPDAGLPPRLAENRAALEALRNHPTRHRTEPAEAAAAEAEPLPVRAPFAVRYALQRQRFGLPPLPTTTIGSLPQTADIRRDRLALRNGRLTEAEYRARIRGHIERWIRLQEEIGLDVLVHGEFERTDMVEHFARLLDGFHFTDNGWVQSYGSRCVKPPVIYGDVADRGPMTLDETLFAQSLTDRPVKGMLTGPVTMVAWSFLRDDLPPSAVAEQIARALNAEVLRLEAAGIGMIQVDEPALREIAPLKRREWPAYLEWAVRAFRRSVAGVKDETQIHTHMCYCDYHDMLDAIEEMDADVISLESSRSHGALLHALRERPYANGIGLGVYDIHSPVVPETETMLGVIRDALALVPAERLWVNPDCGLKTRGEPETVAALRRMVKAARLARETLAARDAT